MTERLEQFSNVVGYEGLYLVSDTGRVFSIRWNKFMSTIRKEGTYVNVNLVKDNEIKTAYIHRLVAEAFLPNPGHLPEVNHKDGNKQNNNVENLEWCSHSENMVHCWKQLHKEKRGKAVVGIHKVEDSVIYFKSCTSAAEYFHMNKSNITSSIKRGGTCQGYYWHYASEDEIAEHEAAEVK